MNNFMLHGSLKATDGHGDKLAEILLEASCLVSKQPGCIAYLVSRDLEDNDLVWVTEVWKNQEAHQASLGDAEVRELIGQAIPLMSKSQAKGQKLKNIGGLGLRLNEQ